MVVVPLLMIVIRPVSKGSTGRYCDLGVMISRQASNSDDHMSPANHVLVSLSPLGIRT